MKRKINYRQLGGVERQKPIYKEGATMTHYSGIVYRRIDGNWVPQTMPAPKAKRSRSDA